MTIRSIHVVGAVTEEASGPSYSVPRLCESLIKAGVSVELGAYAWTPQKVALPYLREFPLGLPPRKLGQSPALRDWLRNQATSGTLDVLHSHGLWMMLNVYGARACRGTKVRHVVSPRGTLSKFALGQGALQKRIFWRLLQARALREASCLHATAEHEYDDIRRAGLKNPVCIIPNGIDIPPLDARAKPARRKLLFLGRIHPGKGIDHLLKAWKVVSARFPDWDLELAGPDNAGYLPAMQALAGELKLERARFVGPLFGAAKLAAYRDASLYVLPTHSENFGMTVAEALSAGTPAIVTTGAPWSGLERNGAGWWIGIGVEPLVACLEQALATPPPVLEQMGQAGRAWMIRDFGWEGIGAAMAAVYRWLLEGGTPPGSVKLD